MKPSGRLNIGGCPYRCRIGRVARFFDHEVRRSDSHRTSPHQGSGRKTRSNRALGNELFPERGFQAITDTRRNWIPQKDLAAATRTLLRRRFRELHFSRCMTDFQSVAARVDGAHGLFDGGPFPIRQRPAEPLSACGRDLRTVQIQRLDSL